MILAAAIPVRRSSARSLALVAGLLVALGCDAGGDAPAPGRAASESGELGQSRELNVLFVILDAASARYFGSYGNVLPTSPNIDALAAEGTLFERAYSQASSTARSAKSYLTGKYSPFPPGPTWRRKLEDDTLAVQLSRAGLKTIAFSENPFVVREFGFGPGFDEFVEVVPRDREDQRLEVDSSATVDRVIGWIDANKQERFFAYVHLLPPHSPYIAPAPFYGRFDPDYKGNVHGTPEGLGEIRQFGRSVTLRDLEHLRREYQENLAYGDSLVGRLIDKLRSDRLLDRTLVVVTADHGEAFREHEDMVHGTTVYDEVIHVPLVVRFPSRLGAFPSRWPGVVELRQLMPTILDAVDAGDASSGGRRGSVLPLLRRPDSPQGGIARSVSSGFFGGSPMTAVITDQYKLIVETGGAIERTSLFDLRVDPGEDFNIAARHPDVVEKLKQILPMPADQIFRTQDLTIDESRQEQLRALGYAPDFGND